MVCMPGPRPSSPPRPSATAADVTLHAASDQTRQRQESGGDHGAGPWVGRGSGDRAARGPEAEAAVAALADLIGTPSPGRRAAIGRTTQEAPRRRKVTAPRWVASPARRPLQASPSARLSAWSPAEINGERGSRRGGAETEDLWPWRRPSMPCAHRLAAMRGGAQREQREILRALGPSSAPRS